MLGAQAACGPSAPTVPAMPTVPAATQPPTEVMVAASTAVADFRVYQPGAWLTARQLPYGNAVLWRANWTGNSAYDRRVAPLSSSCGRYDQNAVTDPNTVQIPQPFGALSQAFGGDAPGGALLALNAMETHRFYSSASDAATAFAAYEEAFDRCALTMGAAAPAGVLGPVTHTVWRSVTSPVAGAWVHAVRSPPQATKAGQIRADSDSHEYAVVHGNVFAILAITSRSVPASDAAPDPILIRQMATALGAYDGPPGPLALPLDPRADLWQVWPAPADLPPFAGWEWVEGNGGGVGEFAPGRAGPLGGVACTPVTGSMPIDEPTLTGHRTRGYDLYFLSGPVDGPRSTAQIDLFTFTSAGAATVAYNMFVADLRSCQPRLRAAQSAAGVTPDVVVDEVTGAAGIAVWTVTGSRLLRSFPGLISPDEDDRPRVQHVVMLLLRGPLVESIGVAVAPITRSAFTPAANLATAVAAAKNLCRYDIGC